MELNSEFVFSNTAYVAYVSNYWFIPFDLGFENQFKGNYGIKEAVNAIAFYFEFNLSNNSYSLRFSAKHSKSSFGLGDGLNYFNLFSFVDRVDGSKLYPETPIIVEFANIDDIHNPFPDFRFKLNGYLFEGVFPYDSLEFFSLRRGDLEYENVGSESVLFRRIARKR